MLPLLVGTLLFSVLFENGFGLGQSRINQGQMVGTYGAAYVVRIRMKINDTVSGACGGSILNEMLILTAGHCVTAEWNMNMPNPPLFDPSNFTVLIGTGDLADEESGEVYSVSKVHFKEFSQQNDIAILELSERIILDGITKEATTLVRGFDYMPKNRTKAFVEGWGKNPQKTDKILRANVYTISEEECNTGADSGRNRSHQICTLGDNGAGPCIGDSGGPLVRAADGVQIGLVSLVPSDCANPSNTISTYTALAPNLFWIYKILATTNKPWEPTAIYNRNWLGRHREFLRTTASRGKDIKIIFLGSSTMEFWNTTGGEIWYKKYAPLGAVNYGIYGDGTDHVLWRIENGELDGLSPKLIVLYAGSNNVPFFSEEDCVRGVNTLIDKLHKKLPETKILYVGFFPRGDVPPVKETLQKIRRITNTLKPMIDGDESRNSHFLDIFFAYAPESLDSINEEYYVLDKLHQNYDGYALWDELMNSTFYSLFES